MAASTETNTAGGSLLGLLGIAFIVLKLVGTIDWSWWWVLAPFWGPLALLLVVGVIGAIVVGLITAIRR